MNAAPTIVDQCTKNAAPSPQPAVRTWLILAAIAVALLSLASVGWWSSSTEPSVTQASPAGTEKARSATPKPATTEKGEHVSNGITLYSRIHLHRVAVVRASDLDWDWVEKDPRNNNELSVVTFQFREIASTSTELTLHDNNRDMYARLNFVDRRAYCRIGTQGPWQWDYDILEAE
jgi:hypothetical protein